jgi:hypothetical protein
MERCETVNFRHFRSFLILAHLVLIRTEAD